MTGDVRKCYQRSMKTLLFLLALALPVLAEGYRQWEDLASGKKITARIEAKERDNSRVQVVLENGKAVWIETARLARADREFVEDWGEKPEPFTHAFSEKGGKKILTITVNAADKDLYLAADIGGNASGNIREMIPAHTSRTFTMEVTPPNYLVRVVDDSVNLVGFLPVEKEEGIRAEQKRGLAWFEQSGKLPFTYTGKH